MKKEYITLKLKDIKLYDKNPRKNDWEQVKIEV